MIDIIIQMLEEEIEESDSEDDLPLPRKNHDSPKSTQSPLVWQNSSGGLSLQHPQVTRLASTDRLLGTPSGQYNHNQSPGCKECIKNSQKRGKIVDVSF